MAYTFSNAMAGLGSILNINTGTASTPVWVLVGEVVEIAQSGRTIKSDDTTNLQSSFEEFLGVIGSSGNLKLTLNRVSGNAGQAAMFAAFTTVPPVLSMFQIQLKKSPLQNAAGDLLAFTALIEEWNDIATISPTKKIMTSASLKVTGTITTTEGS